MYTTEQIALKAHIEAENKAFNEKCQASGAQWWTTTTSDIDHLAGYGVTTIAQYERQSLESELW